MILIMILSKIILLINDSHKYLRVKVVVTNKLVFLIEISQCALLNPSIYVILDRLIDIKV